MHIGPFVCCNVSEFSEELNLLRCQTFLNLKSTLRQSGINFSPVQIEYTESDPYYKSGNLLRLLLSNVRQAQPFIIGLVGFKYGCSKPKAEIEQLLDFKSGRNLTPFEKNLLIASHTGFHDVVNRSTFSNSFFEHQVNLACASKDASFYRFYFRQFEYFEEKLNDATIDKRKETLKSMEAEDEWAKKKLDELKLRLVNQGIVIRYYRNLDQLNRLVLADFEDILKGYLSKKAPNLIEIESFLFRKLHNYVETSGVKEALKKIDQFLKYKQTHGVHFNLDGLKSQTSSKFEEQDNSEFESAEESIYNESDDFLEIIRLRHSALSNRTRCHSSKSGWRSMKNVMLITGERGCGKTCLLANLYGAYVFGSEWNQTTSVPQLVNQYCLFYFLKSGDSLINILVDVTYKMRLKYLEKYSRPSLDQELSDQHSLIQQFHASLTLGPLCLVIDGLGELDRDHSISFDQWFPSKIDSNVKFIFTLSRTSELFLKMSSRKFVCTFEFNTFGNDSDYHALAARIFQPTSSINWLYSKYFEHFDELKQSNHIQSPLFLCLVLHEISTLNENIFKNQLIYQSDEVSISDILNSERDHSESVKSGAVAPQVPNISNLFVEDVSTIREIFEKMIKRYIKKNNWSTHLNIALSPNNYGWMGQVLSMIAISKAKLTKEDIFRLLELSGFKDKLKITDLDWAIFRLKFGALIIEDKMGKIDFIHEYFREAVQTILLNGQSIVIDLRPGPNLPASRKNISSQQRKVHFVLIFDLLRNQLDKDEFDLSTLIGQSALSDHNQFLLEEKYIGLIHQLIYHLYMVYDLVNLCKFITNFKVLHLFNKNRIKFLTEWNDLTALIRLTTNSNLLRSILLTSLTIGIPQYKIDFDATEASKLEIILNQSELAESQPIPDGDTALDAQIKAIEFESILRDQELDANYPNGCPEVYESIVDDLLGLSESDLDTIKAGDSANLMLIQRCILLIDLINFLPANETFDAWIPKLCAQIDSIVIQNFPLSDVEKAKFGSLLQIIAKIEIKMKNFKLGLGYYLRAIELLEDFFATFHLNKNGKNVHKRIELFQLSHRLSFLYSNVAYLVIKHHDDVHAMENLLKKASSFNSERLSSASHLLQSSRLITSKLDHQIKEERSLSKLIYRPSLSQINRKKPSFLDDELLLKCKDGSSYEADIFFSLINALFSVKQENYKLANKAFQNALNKCLKWYGVCHSNTAQIYHSFGSFLSLQNMEFFHPRRAELYYRRALKIKKLQKEAKSIRKNCRVPCEYGLNLESDDIVIAEILFDLGRLLATFDSIIAKNESFECLQRSLDIKSLYVGPNHEECLKVKKILTDLIQKTVYNRQENQLSSRELSYSSISSLFNRLSVSTHDGNRSSARSSIDERFSDSSEGRRFKRISVSRRSQHDNNLCDWIERNSLIGTNLDQNTHKRPQTWNANQSIRSKNTPSSLSYSTHGTLAKLLETKEAKKSSREKVLKHIYYKSAWYDIPPGSSRRRFRNFIKLKTNE